MASGLEFRGQRNSFFEGLAVSSEKVPVEVEGMGPVLW